MPSVVGIAARTHRHRAESTVGMHLRRSLPREARAALISGRALARDRVSSLTAIGNRIARALGRLAPIAVAIAEPHALVADHAGNEVLARAARKVFGHLHPAVDDRR